MILTVLLSIFVVLNACSAEDINNGEDAEITAKATESRYRVEGGRVSFPVEVFDMLMGRYNNGGGFRRGGCGVTYIRWGRTSCPSGATTLYTGRAGGSHYTQKGGGANYLCVPNNPQYLRAGGGNHVPLYGAEYQNTIVGRHDSNVPCSVCYASRSAKIVIPAAIVCPNQWTKEYRGYLMTEYHGHPNNRVFECVDESSEIIAGSQRNTDGALFYHVTSSCGAGMPCPPFIKARPVTCIVCTK